MFFFISFCLYRACFTHLISSNLSCNPCLWYYDQLVHFDKEINANVYLHSLWEYYKRFHYSFEWHLTPGRHPVLSGHYSIPRGCPLNTGFTVMHHICCFLVPEKLQLVRFDKLFISPNLIPSVNLSTWRGDRRLNQLSPTFLIWVNP